MTSSWDREIDQAFSSLKSICGGVRNDYFGLVYLEKEYSLPREKAVNQVSFGGNDFGVDAFHFDERKRNLYLFQFKYSEDYRQFTQSMEKLIEEGLEQIFLSPNTDWKKNSLLLQLGSCILENRALIAQVCIRFVYLGDPEQAERSEVLMKLREDLENRKHVIDQFFGGRPIALLVEFRSASGKVGSMGHQIETPVYNLELDGVLRREGPEGQQLLAGFVRLVDLAAIYQGLGRRFFERNIRYGLGDNGAVNRALMRAFREILLEGREAPGVFAFNHNGITIFAEKVEEQDGSYQITVPRLLNGAQTITTFCEFVKKHQADKRFEERQDALNSLHVLCKIITRADQPFVTTVTINNNRQNPVEPWELHANDMIQLQMQDWFRLELGIYYERQASAFHSLSPEELKEAEIKERGKAVELLKLAQTYLVSDGNIAALSNMRRVFEDESAYSQVFNENRLRADPRHVILCYKIQFRLRRLLKEIEEKGKNKYWFVNRARALLWALLCQGVLNDPKVDELADEYASDMTLNVDYTNYLASLSTTRCRPLLAALIEDPAYSAKVADENLSFLRSNAAYRKCMEYAYNRWGWIEKRLR